MGKIARVGREKGTGVKTQGGNDLGDERGKERQGKQTREGARVEVCALSGQTVKGSPKRWAKRK